MTLLNNQAYTKVMETSSAPPDIASHPATPAINKSLGASERQELANGQEGLSPLEAQVALVVGTQAVQVFYSQPDESSQSLARNMAVGVVGAAIFFGSGFLPEGAREPTQLLTIGAMGADMGRNLKLASTAFEKAKNMVWEKDLQRIREEGYKNPSELVSLVGGEEKIPAALLYDVLHGKRDQVKPEDKRVKVIEALYTRKLSALLQNPQLMEEKGMHANKGEMRELASVQAIEDYQKAWYLAQRPIPKLVRAVARGVTNTADLAAGVGIVATGMYAVPEMLQGTQGIIPQEMHKPLVAAITTVDEPAMGIGVPLVAEGARRVVPKIRQAVNKIVNAPVQKPPANPVGK